MLMGFETENDEVVCWDPVERVPETEEDAACVIPTAKEQCERIARERAAAGEAFRAGHPELVAKLAELLGNVSEGPGVFVGNQHREYNIDEVRQCLAGLGYEVKVQNPMIQNPYAPFRIVWSADERSAPELE